MQISYHMIQRASTLQIIMTVATYIEGSLEEVFHQFYVTTRVYVELLQNQQN